MRHLTPELTVEAIRYLICALEKLGQNYEEVLKDLVELPFYEGYTEGKSQAYLNAAKWLREEIE